MIGQAKRIFELKKISELEPANKSDSTTPIISFTSGKGGTGKTFLCLNIAYRLAKMGKKVLVVDFDLNFSNIHIMLNIIPEKTLYEVLSLEYMLKELVYKFDSHLHFIFGFSGFEEHRISINSIRYFVNQLNSIAENYDFILLDTSSGGNDETLEILSLSDCNVVIANPEPTATLDAYAIIKMISISKMNSPVKIIMNKFFKQKDAESAFQNLTTAVNHFLKKEIEFLGSVSFDQEITQSIMDQELFLLNHSSGKIMDQINLIARGITYIKQVANNNHP